MKNEEKNLLIKDLCGRLPYGVKIKFDSIKETVFGISELGYLFGSNHDIIPYLRPMSSMTEDEKTMFNSIWDSDWDKALTNQIAKAWDRNGFENQTKILEIAACANAINFLISHHFDYNGLIEKGLAIEAPKDMYNIK